MGIPKISNKQVPPRSDWYWLEHLIAKPSARAPLDSIQVYKACAAMANTGLGRPEEEFLSEEYRLLLDARRLLANSQFEHSLAVLEQIQKLEKTKPIEKTLIGDRKFLGGMIHFRLGRYELSEKGFHNAAIDFNAANEEHRALRALINMYIAGRDLNRSISGEVVSLERISLRSRCHDLVGNIKKARAIELTLNSEFDKALIEVRDALSHYEIDGCPEDRSLSYGLLAILNLVTGDRSSAETAFLKIHHPQGKARPYLEVFRALRNGKAPVISPEHPLAKVSWNAHMIRSGSVLGKLLQTLKKGPITRDELIIALWGQNAQHPSYRQRLFSAIHNLKKTSNVKIIFDGETYKLVS